MDSVGSHAMSSARELRRTTVHPAASARAGAHMRGTPRSVTCANWFQQRKTPVASDVAAENNSENTPSSGTPVVSTTADEEFLKRARKMQRRIAKLKRLQERLTQLREERDFLQAYAEVEASAADSDSDADEDDERPLARLSTAPGSGSGLGTRSSSNPGAGPTATSTTNTTGSTATSATSPSSGHWPPPLRSPGPSASAEELRQWVAAVVEQSAARSAGVRPPLPGTGDRSSASASSSSAAGNGSSPTSSSSSSGSSSSSNSNIYVGTSEVGSSRQGGRGQQPPPPLPPPPTAAYPPPAVAAATAPPRPGSSSNYGKSSSNSSSSNGNGNNAEPGVSSRATPSGPSVAAPGSLGGTGAVRRYTVRYSPNSSKPVFVQVPPGGAQAGNLPVAAAGGGAAAPAGPPAAAVGAAAAATAPSHPPPPPPPPLLLRRDDASALASASAGTTAKAPTAASVPPPSATSSSAAAPPPPLPPRTHIAADWRRTALAAVAPSPSPPPPRAQQLQAQPQPQPSATAVPRDQRQRQQQQQKVQAAKPAKQAVPAAAGAGAVGAPAAAAAAAGATTSPPTAADADAEAASRLDPNAELRATAFPEAVTSTNPYTLYDMPLPPLPLPKSWQTAAERRAEAEAAAAGSGTAAAGGGGGPGRAERPRDLVFVTAEAAPWSKTGGLGDVMGALPQALAARGHRVMVVSPRYLAPSTTQRYAGLVDTGVRARLDLGGGPRGGGVHEVGYFHTHRDGVDWVFVDHMSYHREGTPYGNEHGTYGDNLFRFALLSQAACEAPLLLHIGGYRSSAPPGLPYGQNVTFIANDWHAGLVPVYVAAKYRRHGVFREARCVLALHNLAHQGAHPPHCFDSLGLPGEWYGALEWVQTPGAGAGAGGAQAGGGGGQQRVPTINILKAAMVTSDRLVTVSPAYAWEITAQPRAAGTSTGSSSSRGSSGSSSGSGSGSGPAAGAGTAAAAAGSAGADGGPHQAAAAAGGAAGGGGGGGGGAVVAVSGEDHGMGLGSLLRQRAGELAGIVNGIDTAEWDPRTDPYLPRNYHEGSLGGKGLCKAALQQSLGLPPDPAAPLLGFIGRLDYQKGPDLVLQALPRLVAAGCQVVLLGSGAPDYEAAFRAAAASFPANVRAHVGFSVPLSHRILAAADILLMPSRFEPCGLNQLYAMRYGTVPVAHGTGGLRDTIDDVKPFLGEEPGSRRGKAGEAEDLEELFEKGLAWGRRLASRSADDPSTNNAEYYQPFQDYFGSSGRYGPVSEEGEYDDDQYDNEGDESDSEDGGGCGGELSGWRRALGPGVAPPRGRSEPGTGWTFSPATAEALLDAVTAALAVYEHHPDKWRRIQAAGMRRDFSWGRAARQWEAVMEGAHAAVSYCK